MSGSTVRRAAVIAATNYELRHSTVDYKSAPAEELFGDQRLLLVGDEEGPAERDLSLAEEDHRDRLRRSTPRSPTWSLRR